MTPAQTIELLKHYLAIAECKLQEGERPETLLPLLRLAAQLLEQNEAG